MVYSFSKEWIKYLCKFKLCKRRYKHPHNSMNSVSDRYLRSEVFGNQFQFVMAEREKLIWCTFLLSCPQKFRLVFANILFSSFQICLIWSQFKNKWEISTQDNYIVISSKALLYFFRLNYFLKINLFCFCCGCCDSHVIKKSLSLFFSWYLE